MVFVSDVIDESFDSAASVGLWLSLGAWLGPKWRPKQNSTGSLLIFILAEGILIRIYYVYSTAD